MKHDQKENVTIFKTIFDQTPISTQIFSPDGKTLMVNKAWERLWNVPAASAASYNILEDKQLVESGSMPYIVRGFKGETVTLPAIKYDAKIPSKVKHASTRWLSATTYPIKNGDGKITHIVLQHEDITVRKLSEEAVRESEERFRTLTSHAPVGIFLTDKEGNCLFVNERWCKLTGIKNDEAMGKGWARVLHPEDKNRVSDAWYDFAKNGRDFNMEYRFRTPAGKVVWAEGSAVALRDRKKNVTGYMGTVADITDRKNALDSLEDSEERLRLALDAGKIGVWDWDIPSNKLTWTENVYTIHGVKKGQFNLTFNNFKRLIHPDDKKRVIEQIEKSLKQDTEFDIEFRITPPKGDLRWVTTRAIVSYNKKGEPIRMLGATSDITRQKQIEQEKSDFIGMASHELKTPITGMKMFVELLHRELLKSDMQKPLNYSKRIKDQTDRLVELTNDLLDVSRIETGKLQIRKTNFELAKTIEETVESLRTTSHKLLVKNTAKISVRADRYRIYQVLVNLITNAIKYSPKGEKIIIGLGKNQKEIVVSITDHGIGIAKDKQEKIFERLYQVTDNKLKSYPGLGLGLYISQEIVKRHGGRLWLKSEKGKGSTFYFSLPLDKP